MFHQMLLRSFNLRFQTRPKIMVILYLNQIADRF